MSKVRAKFFVKQIINHHNGDPTSDQAGVVVLGPVYDDDNKQWSKWTPQGRDQDDHHQPS